jgi:4-hydroxy-2-oxoglutarate aldolase
MFEGVYPPVPTPFVDGEVAHDRLVKNLAGWNQTDLAGYIVLGSNGETVSERG